jgi:hypothetical protein
MLDLLLLTVYVRSAPAIRKQQHFVNVSAFELPKGRTGTLSNSHHARSLLFFTQ